VVVDVIIGSAFACGGFSVAMLVYIFNRGEYHPLVRPALLASLFGYTLAAAGSYSTWAAGGTCGTCSGPGSIQSRIR
jgi:hypothetical protein